MRLPERDQEVKALPAQADEEAFAEGIGLGRPDRSAEDPATQCRDGRVESRRIDAIPIMEDEPIPSSRREDFAELLPSPGGRRVAGDAEVKDSAPRVRQLDPYDDRLRKSQQFVPTFRHIRGTAGGNRQHFCCCVASFGRQFWATVLTSAE